MSPRRAGSKSEVQIQVHLFTKHFWCIYMSVTCQAILHCTMSQHCLIHKNHDVNNEIGKMAFKYYAPHKWNSLQKSLLINLNPCCLTQSRVNAFFLWIGVVPYVDVPACFLYHLLMRLLYASIVSTALLYLYFNFYTYCIIHQSGITSWPLTGEVNNTNYLFIMAPRIY